ncbi:MAG: transaldolase, partial [Microbacteriaceae bacterium]|nr:transaldolase [Microbacteriaceae bacterium]
MTESTSPLADLTAVGVSIWLDDLSRERIATGGLQKLIAERNVVGVTTNPTIFASALAKGEAYDAQVAELAAAGTSVTEAVFEITTHDVTAASDIFRPVYDASNGFDGRVSIEVEPGLAHDTAGTIAEAKTLWAKVDRPNVMIKIPATVAGLEAITESIAAGISVNVTLIFSLERHRAVINAYLNGLEKAKAAGLDLSTIHSVASFFVSRVDTEIDKRLDAIGTAEATALKSKAGIANARLAYQVYEQAFDSERAKLLLASGANKQRPLWASTGVKSPDLPDTLYVTELAVADVVNTMPEKTLEATFDHGVIEGDRVTGF